MKVVNPVTYRGDNPVGYVIIASRSNGKTKLPGLRAFTHGRYIGGRRQANSKRQYRRPLV